MIIVIIMIFKIRMVIYLHRLTVIVIKDKS